MTDILREEGNCGIKNNKRKKLENYRQKREEWEKQSSSAQQVGTGQDRENAREKSERRRQHILGPSQQLNQLQ